MFFLYCTAVLRQAGPRNTSCFQKPKHARCVHTHKHPNRPESTRHKRATGGSNNCDGRKIGLHSRESGAPPQRTATPRAWGTRSRKNHRRPPLLETLPRPHRRHDPAAGAAMRRPPTTTTVNPAGRGRRRPDPTREGGRSPGGSTGRARPPAGDAGQRGRGERGAAREGEGGGRW